MSIFRRVLSVAFAAAALLVLADAAVALDCEEGQRPFRHAVGEDCIPLDPQRIVTLQDQNALLPLMELGVRPVASAGYIDSSGRQIFRRMEGYDTSGIAWIGTHGEPDLEAVAVMKPDLIIAPLWPANRHRHYSRIAPTVVIDTQDQPLEQALFQFAELVSRTERARELQAALEEKAAALGERLGPALEATTISVVTREYRGSGFYAVGPSHAFGSVRRLLKPTMTRLERDWNTEHLVKSLEMLGEHPADVLFFVAFDADEGPGSREFEAFLAQPLVRVLPVARAGQIYRLDGSAMTGSAWGKIESGLDAIAAVLARPDLNRNLVRE
jgi:iron complex transport system substrate-binding protein